MSLALHKRKASETDLEELYQTFYQRVYRAAMVICRDPYLAEDIIQETFIKAIKKLDTLADHQKIGPWLLTIASRTAIDTLRKEKRKRALSLDSIAMFKKDMLMEACDVERDVESLLFEQEVQADINQLKPEFREIILLKCFKGLKENEIAAKLGLSKGTVKSRLYRARQQMRCHWKPPI
ncbi:RNA polymerase sigma-70 factor (ECF subfamily) [Scopulibacillus darangshiensis]|uniref:RNA polymerase sigma factor n=1 Tax=Scopulibacillus darangshiensis TaxID=442528 RepID=A0A4R2P3B6_9BACL|nr:RNA polymerase sigma factor [Scopulibacillus darangshiensis]TCP29162.1 RNA polymerase sigma-70 factor (ECF subfamily) [Scopulibacillus darangshiensis]